MGWSPSVCSVCSVVDLLWSMQGAEIVLEKPDLPDEKLITCLRADYGLPVVDVAFLPLGADANTAVYRVADDARTYFLKLRRGAFDEASVAVPRFLSDHSVAPVIAPIETRDGRLWTRVNDFAATLYPFVEGRNGQDAPPSDRHWVELGAALRGMHAVVLPPALAERIPRETYSPYWRDMVRDFQAQAEATACRGAVRGVHAGKASGD